MVNQELAQKHWTQRAVEIASSLWEQVVSVVAAKARMGVGVRLCQGFFVLVLLAMLGYALMTNPSDFTYDFSLVHSFVVVALASVCVWLFQKRASPARTFGIATAVTFMVLSAFDMFVC